MNAARFSTIGSLGALALGLALAGCQSKAEKEVDQQAEAIDKSYQAQADLKDALAPTASNAAELRNEADALRAQGEKTEAHLKNMADELDEVPKK
jgi:septal ring factor EnvC (AmiA/AmiB activator)